MKAGWRAGVVKVDGDFEGVGVFATGALALGNAARMSICLIRDQGGPLSVRLAESLLWSNPLVAERSLVTDAR